LPDFVFVRPGFSCCKRRCPLRCSWPQQAFSTRRCAPSASSPLDPKGSLPWMWTGHLRATALAATNRARVHPLLGVLRRRAAFVPPPPVVAPRAHPCACPRSGSLMPTRRSCLPFRRRFRYILALQ
jgi:hypothetical protein